MKEPRHKDVQTNGALELNDFSCIYHVCIKTYVHTMYTYTCTYTHTLSFSLSITVWSELFLKDFPLHLNHPCIIFGHPHPDILILRTPRWCVPWWRRTYLPMEDEEGGIVPPPAGTDRTMTLCRSAHWTLWFRTPILSKWRNSWEFRSHSV
jgi:hypothetical protein